MPMMINYLEPVPTTFITTSSFKSTYYPVASTDLIVNGKIYAIPFGIDTLGLYVNTDLLTAAGVEIPTEWEQFREAARKLTVRDGGRIKTAGAALGNAINVDHWQDILALMMSQAGVDMEKDAASIRAQEALLYYTTFSSVDKVWNQSMENSTMAFAQGRVAMYFGPSWRFFDIKNINKNINFRVVPVPQLAGADKVNYASYWAEVVSKNSANKEAAFAFLKFLTSQEVMEKMYTEASKIRAYGEPYARVSMASKMTTDPNVGPFIAGAGAAKSSYLASFTGDGETGINTRISNYYADAVNGATGGSGARGALDTVASGIRQVLGGYGLK
jgi:multiple sugar transport system substrate-binding protein